MQRMASNWRETDLSMQKLIVKLYFEGKFFYQIVQDCRQNLFAKRTPCNEL